MTGRPDMILDDGITCIDLKTTGPGMVIVNGRMGIDVGFDQAPELLSPPPPGSKRYRPTPPYEAKTPTTAADHEKVRLATIKRERKARRQAKGTRP